MDELFWGRDHEDVNDWVERLTMVAESARFECRQALQDCEVEYEG